MEKESRREKKQREVGNIMKVKVKCPCGQWHLIKIPFRLRKKIEKIELFCFKCRKERTLNFIYTIKNNKGVL